MNPVITGSVRAVVASAGFRLRMYWRGALAVVLLGILAIGLLDQPRETV